MIIEEKLNLLFELNASTAWIDQYGVKEKLASTKEYQRIIERVEKIMVGRR